MQFIFTVVAFAGLAFFFAYRRQFDFVSAAFVGMLIYFFPGFVGYVTNPYYPWLDPSIPIVDGTYVVWICAMLGTIAAGILYNPPRVARPAFETSNGFDLAVIVTIGSTLAAALWFGGEEVLSPDKHEVLESIDRWFILFSTSSQIGLVAFVAQKKLLKAIIPAAGVLFLLFLGFRTGLALATIGIATYFAYRRGVLTYIRPLYLVMVAGIGVVLLAYKPLLNAYRYGRLDLAESYLASEDLLSDTILKSEPFITQTILNEVVSQNFEAGVGSLFYSLTALVPFLANILKLDPTEIAFNFQEQIFPHLTYGAGSNIYGHFYATLGAAGLAIFIMLHNLALIGLSKLLASRSPYVPVLAISMGAFFAFYIHRNDLLNSILSLNRYVLTMAIFFVLAFAFEGRSGNRAVAEAG